MKKIILIIFTALICIATASGVLASVENPYVVDELNALTAEELSDAEKYAQAIQDKYGYDIVVLMIKDQKGMTTQEYTENYLNNHSYNRDTLLLCLNYTDLLWYIKPCGAFEDWLSQSDADVLFSAFDRADTYTGGIRAFVDAVVELLTKNTEETPFAAPCRRCGSDKCEQRSRTSFSAE